MGSGHILVYMFDVLMDIYRSEGFSEREAVFDILEKNIRGLDIDRRAYQLSYFALMMKARGYNRIFFRGHEDIDGNRVQANPKVYAIEESNSIVRSQLEYLGADLDEEKKETALKQLNGLLDAMHDAKEYGSIINVENYDWNLLRKFISDYSHEGQVTVFETVGVQSQALLEKLINIGELLAGKYDAVVTNPPYMGTNNANTKLSEFLRKNYYDFKADLFSAFIWRGQSYAKDKAFNCMVTMQAWMFLSSFDKMRERILETTTIVNAMHMENMVMGIAFGTCVSNFRNTKLDDYKGQYLYVTLKDISKGKPVKFPVINSRYKSISSEEYSRIPGMPIAYWTNESIIRAFEGKLLGDYGYPKQGFATGNNDLFLRLWYEIDNTKMGTGYGDNVSAQNSGFKWFPCNKGGKFRRWYGNNNYVVDWENDGYRMRNYKGSVIRNPKFYFRKGITWSSLTNGSLSMRLSPEGFVFESKGSVCFMKNNSNLEYILGLVNSKIVDELLKILSPTVDYHEGPMSRVPIIMDYENEGKIKGIVKECVSSSMNDGDSFETSWDFKRHPLLPHKDSKGVAIPVFDMNNIPTDIVEGKTDKLNDSNTVRNCYLRWAIECDERFKRLKGNEEELNRIFIDIYGLQDELTPKVEDKDITVRIADLQRDVKSLVSYAVGCMFGRYSLDEEGLVFAGGEFDKTKYKTFPADADAIIPITDESYFEDDIVGRFEEFIRVVYGEDKLEENLDFIADALGTKGSSSREKLRNYFLNSFFKDHCATYSVTGSGKRPIYWLFDAGKQNGFKCLIYLHRYTPDTVGLIRSDYLTKTQSMIENALKNAEYAISISTSAVDRAQATKKRDKYIKQLAEIRAYYPALSHIALQRIPLDLDDGVKVNYARFQGIEVSVEGEKKQKVNLLAKI